MKEPADSIFHRTAEGGRAASRSGSRLPEQHRAVLACLNGATHFDAIAAQLGSRSVEQLLRCLEDLEAIGLVESMPLEWLVELHLLCSQEPADSLLGRQVRA